MDYLRKAFLFVVGTVSIAFEQVAKSVNEAKETVEKERAKVAAGH
jgi:hypothetical protein